MIGAGALGKALAYGLQQAALGGVGLYKRSGPLTDSYPVLDQAVLHEVKLDPVEPSAAVQYFFAVKTYDLVAALKEWLPRIPSSARIVLLCNGYIEGLLTNVRSEFPKHVLHKGVVTRGAKFLPNGTLELSEEGQICWGDQGEPSAFENELFERRSEFRWEFDACRRRRDKWYCNTVLNTLSGAHRLACNGAALEHPDYQRLADEVFQLGLMLWPDWAAESERSRLKLLLDRLIHSTRNNENSMAVDVRLNRPVEIEVLSGIAKTVAAYEQSFPLLTHLHRTIETRRV